MEIPTLQGEQTSILYLPKEQNLLIVGSAGTGKSLLAMYKSIYLAVSNPKEKILLLTFNKAVNNKIKEDCKKVCDNLKQEYPDNLEINTIYSFSQRMIAELSSHFHKNGYDSTHAEKVIQFLKNVDRDVVPALTADKKASLITQALEKISKKYSGVRILERDKSTYIEEIGWIERWDVQSIEEYESIERIGRSKHRIIRNDRKYIWEIYESYKKSMQSSGVNRLYSFESVYRYFNQLLETYKELTFEDEGKLKFYKYVIIDEFQDFTPAMVNAIRTLVTSETQRNANKSTYIIIGDVAQSVFGKRISWKKLGFNQHKKHQLSINYRNSYQIANLAEKIAESPYFDKQNEDYVKQVIRDVDKVLPTIYRFESIEAEIKEICNLAIEKGKVGSVGIILPKKYIKNVQNYFDELNIRVKGFSNSYSYSKIQIGTILQVKGLEFETVILPFKSENQYLKDLLEDGFEVKKSKEENILPENTEEILELFITNLYVEVTRAKSDLIISYSGEPTPILPEIKDVNFIDRGYIK